MLEKNNKDVSLKNVSEKDAKNIDTTKNVAEKNIRDMSPHRNVVRENFHPRETAEVKSAQQEKQCKHFFPLFVIVLINVAMLSVVVAGYLLIKNNTQSKSSSDGNKNGSTLSIDSTKYQAVFLTNGQTYFGKITSYNDEYISLGDVYYLILKKPLQDQKDSDSGNGDDKSKPEYTLVKLGKEMHGPMNMSINKEQVLFVENLSDDSKVVSTIKGSK